MCYVLRHLHALPACRSTFVVHAEALRYQSAGHGIELNLRPGPHAEFKDDLEFFGEIVPLIVVAKGMCRQVVGETMFTTCAICQDMIRLPLRIADQTPAYVAASVGRCQNRGALS